MAPFIPFTLAWLIGLWFSSRVALPTLGLGIATGVAAVGIILAWRTPRPRWIRDSDETFFILTGESGVGKSATAADVALGPLLG